jgi:hypothetical protein
MQEYIMPENSGIIYNHMISNGMINLYCNDIQCLFLIVGKMNHGIDRMVKYGVSWVFFEFPQDILVTNW